MLLSHVDAIVSGPVSHQLRHILRLVATRGLESVNDLAQCLARLMSGHDLLKGARTRSSLALPVLGIGIHAFHEIKCSCRIVKVAHLVAIVGDELQQTERLGRLLQLQVELPGGARFVISNVASGEPAQIDVVVFQLLVFDQQERLQELKIKEFEANEPLLMTDRS